MRVSAQIRKEIQSRLSSRVRGAVVFAPKEIFKNKSVTEKIASELHTVISGYMTETYNKHVESKTKNLLETLQNRELIYVDASKKGESDIFSYMTRLYFNNSPEAVRIKYNESMFQDYKEENGNPCLDDLFFDREIQMYKNHPEWNEKGSDCMVGFMPLHGLNMLMLMNHQTDLNIYLDNIENISQCEMEIINNAIRAGLLVSSEQWMGIYINNTKDVRNFLAGTGSQPPQDGHDMRVMYL